jgi:hypothetical protein
MMKKTWPITRAIVAALAAALTLLAGCNNFFHELIPPDENRIVSFRVANQLGGASIGDTGLTVTVGPGTDLAALLPEIQVSPKATLLPLTLAYVAAAFPSVDIAQAAAGIYSANDLSAWVIDLIKANPDFNVPPLTRAMDFTGPVDFLVISGQGTIRRYTAHVSIDTGEAKILGFGFSKYDNPELVSDGLALVNQNNKTIQVIVKYPAEYSASFELIPSFELLGDRLEVEGAEGVEVRSGVDIIQFATSYGTQTKNLTVYRSGCPSTPYTLTVTFIKDLDSIRSITDFRFIVGDNPGIAFDAVASIVNSEDLGTIRVQVLYTGSQPTVLKARFISPGTVTVDDVVQANGITEKDFSDPSLKYKVVSKNGLYSRTYTVQVEWVSVSDLMPRITDFRFSYALNPTLVQDTVGEVNDGAGRILIDAHHGGLFAPDSLVPEFTATGIVRVSGISQSSGISAQDFSRQIKYTVVSPDNPDLQKEYWVQVRFVQDSGASAEITAFSFHPDENPGLTAVGELTARIDPGLGQIFVYLPYGISPAALSTPRFSASGPVSVAGLPQTSGLSDHDFTGPVVYRVDSPNGQNSRTYTVQALSTARIYVDKDATLGNNTGTSWANAYTSLKAACDDAKDDLPPELAKELWIAAGTYRASETGDIDAWFPISSNTSYIGGFAGWESLKTQRDPAANPVVISGELGGDVRSRQLFRHWYTDGPAVTGNIVFEDLAFTGIRTVGGNLSAEICLYGGSGTDLVEIRNCKFANFDFSGYVLYAGAVIINYPSINIDGMTINNTLITFTGVLSGAVWLRASNGPINLHNVVMEGIWFRNASLINIGNSGGGNISISGLRIKNSHSVGYSGAARITTSGGGSINVRDSVFENCSGESFGGAYMSSTGAITVSNTVFRKCVARRSGGFLIEGGSVTVENSDFINCIATRDRRAGEIRSNNSIVRDCRFINDDDALQYGEPYVTPDDPYQWGQHLVLANTSNDPATGLIEDCVFTNLVDQYVVPNLGYYIWSTHADYPGATDTLHLTIRNTDFTLRSDMRLGLVWANSGFLLDNCHINYAPSQTPPTPVFDIGGPGPYEIRSNSSYNGTPLDAAAVAAMNADPALVVRRSGASLTSVP